MKKYYTLEMLEPLSLEQLCNCFYEMGLGNQEAREKIIIHNIRLVMFVIKTKFTNEEYDLEELLSVGIIGLIRSVDTFDINKGYKFNTYSCRVIYNEILSFIIKDSKQKNTRRLEEKDYFLYEKIINNTKDNDFILNYELKDLCERIIDELPEVKKDIVIKYFGLLNNEPLKQSVIAKELCVTQSYISHTIKNILKDLRCRLEELGITDCPTSSFEFQEQKSFLLK